MPAPGGHEPSAPIIPSMRFVVLKHTRPVTSTRPAATRPRSERALTRPASYAQGGTAYVAPDRVGRSTPENPEKERRRGGSQKGEWEADLEPAGKIEADPFFFQDPHSHHISRGAERRQVSPQA